MFEHLVTLSTKSHIFTSTIPNLEKRLQSHFNDIKSEEIITKIFDLQNETHFLK